jgi:hypothetical protein
MQFEYALDLYGGDLDRWPVALRDTAERLTATLPVAREKLDAMRHVESALRADAQAAARSAGLDRLAASAVRHRQMRRTQRVAIRAAWITTAAATLALGVIVGNVLPQRHADAARLMSVALSPPETIDVD